MAVSSSAFRLRHQRQDLALEGDVQGRGGFVGHQQPRPADHGHGDHHPLAHAAGQLVGVITQPVFRRWDAHPVQPPGRFFQGLGPRQAQVRHQGFGHLPADGQHGVQGGHRFLENHTDLTAPDATQGFGIGLQQVPALEANFPRHDAARW
jgi:hypothetical protein